MKFQALTCFLNIVLVKTVYCAFGDMVNESIPMFSNDQPDANTAIATMTAAQAILENDLRASDVNLEESLFESGSLVDNIIIKFQRNPLETTDMIQIASAMIRLTEVTLAVINGLTCTSDTTTTNCKLDSQGSLDYVNITEERLIQFMTVIINLDDQTTEVELQEGSIIVAAVKSEGATLDEKVTKYTSSLQIPYVGQDSTDYNETTLTLYVLNYLDNKYKYVENQKVINSGTSRIIIRDKNGFYIDLYSDEDQLQMVVDASDVMQDPSFWRNLTDFPTNEQFSLNASFYNDQDGALMNVQIKTIMPCVVRGYDSSLNGTISENDAVIDLRLAGGENCSIYKKPNNYKISYSGQILSIVFVPPEDDSESMISVDMTFDCEACLDAVQMRFYVVLSDEIQGDDRKVAEKFVKEMMNYYPHLEFSFHGFGKDFLTMFTVHDTVINSTVISTSNIPNLGVQEARMDEALGNITAYLDTNADWTKKQIVVVITDGKFCGNISIDCSFDSFYSALWSLRSKGAYMMAVGYGSTQQSNIKLLVDSPKKWYTATLTRDPDDDIEEEFLKSFLDNFCYGNSGDLVYNAVRFGRVSALMLNETSNQWELSERIKMKDISMGTSAVTFKSNFLGTFGSNVFIIPPNVINFDEIFVDFAAKLADNPYVLAVDVTCITFMIILMIVLRHFDKKDQMAWNYLPLKDNPRGARYAYYMSFYTGFWSSRRLSATPFVILKGTRGETGARALKDGKRKLFERWTLGNFVLKTDRDIGDLIEIQIWHDSKGDSPGWYLEKVLVYDSFTKEKYAFLCGQWLAADRDDCETQRSLYAMQKEWTDGSVLFGSNTRFNLFDDYLWLSLFSRPSASRFTRVQRSVCVFSMLFLSMLANAMWYGTADGIQTYGIHLGPFKLNYIQLYVGCMSSLITFIPGILMAWIFRNRRFKDNNSHIEEHTVKLMNDGYLPWWSIFIGYTIAISCVLVGGVFSFFYSIEWGKDKSIDWLMAFSLGMLQGIAFLEPIKVIFFTLAIAFLCKKYALKDLGEMAPVSIESDDNTDGTTMVFDDIKNDTSENVLEGTTISSNSKERKRFFNRMYLDRKLLRSARGLFIRAFYIIILAIMCAHNAVWMSYHQNNALQQHLKPVSKINTTDDFWIWLRGQVTDRVFPKVFYNGDARLVYARKFMFDDVSYRLGMTRIRQIRVKGKCDVVPKLQRLISICPPGYSTNVVDRGNYCQGWTPYNEKLCNGTEWTYQTQDEINAMHTFGETEMYRAEGYVKLLDPSSKEVRNDLYSMQSYNWIDLNSRLVVLEFMIFNPNSKLFSFPVITVEIPKTGGFFTNVKIKTARLYPYIDTLDFVVLGFQLVFLAITFCRLLHFVYSSWKMEKQFFFSLSQWAYMLSIATSVAGIIFFIVRIDRTIYTVEEIFNTNGKFLSLDLIDTMDTAYKVCISLELFLAILDLLKPLVFNYHLYLMRTSIALCRRDLLSFGAVTMVPMTAFSMLCYLYFGPYQADFKDIVTTYITLFRTLLAMVKVRDTFKEDDVISGIIFSIFLFLMTIIMMNFLISILNDAFSSVKNNKSASNSIVPYDTKLQKHFWRKIYNILKMFQGNSPNKPSEIDEDKANVIGLSIALDNQIFKIVNYLEQTYRNETRFQNKVKSYQSATRKSLSAISPTVSVWEEQTTYSDNDSDSSDYDPNSAFASIPYGDNLSGNIDIFVTYEKDDNNF